MGLSSTGRCSGQNGDLRPIFCNMCDPLQHEILHHRLLKNLTELNTVFYYLHPYSNWFSQNLLHINFYQTDVSNSFPRLDHVLCNSFVFLLYRLIHGSQPLVNSKFSDVTGTWKTTENSLISIMTWPNLQAAKNYISSISGRFCI